MTGLHGSRRSSISQSLKVGGIGLVTALTLATGSRFIDSMLWANSPTISKVLATNATKAEVAKRLGRRLNLSNTTTIENDFAVQFTIDERLQQAAETSLRRGQIPYGAFVAIDPTTGQVLAMASHGMGEENLALRATFPAASIFKIVTAASAIETGVLQYNSMIPVRGSFHTLYKQNILKSGGLSPDGSRYSRLISFDDALAKSVNSVFGKVGIFGVGGEGLRKTAARFQFGKALPFELPADASIATIPSDEFGIAESASGFTRQNTLSPLHGALIAAAVANDGVMMEPTVISKLTSNDGSLKYSSEPKILANALDPKTAAQVAKMMHKTITNGTSRRAFRTMQRNRAFSDVFVAGKTGSLDGWDPPGRYDWFVGYAERGGRKIAVAALSIHGELRGVKASSIARDLIETFFSPVVADNLPKTKRSRI